MVAALKRKRTSDPRYKAANLLSVKRVKMRALA